MKLLTIVCLYAIALPCFSQSLGNLNKLIQGGKNDAAYLLTDYAKPLLDAFPYGLNQGWYNTAKPHSLGGFDVTIYGSLVSIPTAHLSYTIDNSKLERLVHVKADGVTPSTDPVPTVFGVAAAPRYNYKGSSSAATAFNSLGGLLDLKQIGYQSLPVPMFNAGIGLPGRLELKARFLPKITIGNTDVSLWGVGAMFDIKRFIPVIAKRLFDISLFAAYTTINANTIIDNKKEQHAEFIGSGATLQALISKKIGMLTLYGGLGYNQGWINLKVKGAYDMGNGSQIKDPLHLSLTSPSPRLTAGAQIKLTIFVFSFDYTLQKYSTATAGFGFDLGRDNAIDNKPRYRPRR